MSPFSKRIKEEVLSSFPEWTGLATTETYKDSTPYLAVIVPAPLEAETNFPLRISTYDEEITVDFDYYHTHFDHWNPDEGDDRHNSALLYVKAILSETVAAASWWQGDHCKMCSQIQPGNALKPLFNISFTHVRVRSWCGTHNEN